MKKRLGFVTFLGAISALSLAVVVSGQGGQRGPVSAPGTGGQATPQNYVAQRTLLKEYCVACHNNRARTGGFSLEGIDISRVGENRMEWEKVVRKMRAGMMPPPTQE